MKELISEAMELTEMGVTTGKADLFKTELEVPEDLQNELLNIQIELHPAFALLVFQTINEELTWGAITLPVINGGLFGGIAGFAFI